MAEEIIYRGIQFPYIETRGEYIATEKNLKEQKGQKYEPMNEFSVPYSTLDTLYKKLITDYYAKHDKQLEGINTRGTYIGLQEPWMEIELPVNRNTYKEDFDLLRPCLSNKEMASIYRTCGERELRNIVNRYQCEIFIMDGFKDEGNELSDKYENGEELDQYIKCENAYYINMREGRAQLWHGNKLEATIEVKYRSVPKIAGKWIYEFSGPLYLSFEPTFYVSSEAGSKVFSTKELLNFLSKKILSDENIMQVYDDVLEASSNRSFDLNTIPMEKNIFQQELFKRDNNKKYQPGEIGERILARYDLLPSSKEVLRLPLSKAPLGAREAARQQYAINNPRQIVKPQITPQKPSESQGESKAQSRGRGR